VPKPWNADPLAQLEPFDSGSDRVNPTNDLVPGDDRRVWMGQFTVRLVFM
jgi:hypothetical protein